jgi:hypothetical protein
MQGPEGIENRMRSIADRIDRLETYGEKNGLLYDPEVARANPVPNPTATGTNINPQQAQNFQAMIQMMQSQMISGSFDKDNDNNNSGLGSLMNNPMVNQMMMGQQNAQGMPGMQQAMPGAAMNPFGGNTSSGMPYMGNMMPSAGQANSGTQAAGASNQAMGMNSVSPELLKQMQQVKMIDNF